MSLLCKLHAMQNAPRTTGISASVSIHLFLLVLHRVAAKQATLQRYEHAQLQAFMLNQHTSGTAQQECKDKYDCYPLPVLPTTLIN